MPEDCFGNLIPIGDWGAGWGPLCIDLSRPEEQIDENRKETWSLVWFDHEEFEQEEMKIFLMRRRCFYDNSQEVSEHIKRA